MICYLDTSALVKLYVQEQGSELVRALVNEALVVATSKVAFAEARAAFARVYREGGLSQEDYRSAVEAFQAEWEHYLRLEVSDELIHLAGDLAERHQLRGFDAIHLASMQMLSQQVKDPVIVACWDTRLWDAVKAVRFAAVPAERPGSAART
ncbi:MAG: type II toxin-antitoxin system VapC family toxin [Bacillota bacterium]|nr:type II toxin-antitoxin system VapC family toxin [Bacillota bacterium]